MERRQIENKMAPEIAQELTAAFDKFCNATSAANN